MTTVILKLPRSMAERLAVAADTLEMSHDETAREAIRLFLRSIVPPGTGRKRHARKERDS